jgi:ABC-type dipeptide/oligopeptide/nickel transport system permease subunit
MTEVITTIAAAPKKKYYGLSRRARLAQRLMLIIPAAILSILILTAILAPWIAPDNPTKTNMLERKLPPVFMEGGSTAHLLGTDGLGRDILSRLIHGSRVSLSVSMLVIAITATFGTALGIAAGYLGGNLEAVLMRVTDVSMAFPGLLLAMLLSVGIGPGFWTVILALSILGWAPYARMIRGETLKVRELDFVLQARITGASPVRIMLKHIFPNIINSLIVVMTLAVGLMILAEATLSYLGIGIPAPTPSWGSMVADGRNDLGSAWWISTLPGIAMGLVVLSCNFLGDWLRDKLDPRLRRL